MVKFGIYRCKDLTECRRVHTCPVIFNNLKANDIPQVITGDDPDPNPFIEENKTDFWGKHGN